MSNNKNKFSDIKLLINKKHELQRSIAFFQSVPTDFVTKTYLTTYTYLTTFSENGSTVVSSRERVVSNVVTEEIKPTKIPVRKSSWVSDHVTLSSSPELTTGVYHTTYTYFNTMVDGELPLVVTSKRTVANTITEPPVLSLLPSELPVHSTNTYLSTCKLKFFYDTNCIYCAFYINVVFKIVLCMINY